MSFLDIVLGILLIWGLYKGLTNGLFVELASLIALIAGIFGAIHFSYIAGDYLSQNMDWNDRYIKITAFLITFIAIVLLVHLAGKLLTKIADFAMLGLLNKIAGGIFGMLKVAIIMGAEATGVRRMSAELSDELIRIPMAGSVDCLNVSVATGVCLFEAMRQRGLS